MIGNASAQLVLSASVARRHFLDGRSNLEIAEELGLSRFQVAGSWLGWYSERSPDRPGPP